MAIKEMLRTGQIRIDSEIESPVFQLPADKQYIKINMLMHGQDKIAEGLFAKVVIYALENAQWAEKAFMQFDSYGPAGYTNKHGVLNPDQYLRFRCGDLNNKSLKGVLIGNGARVRFVASAMTAEDWAADTDTGA